MVQLPQGFELEQPNGGIQQQQTSGIALPEGFEIEQDSIQQDIQQAGQQPDFPGAGIIEPVRAIASGAARSIGGGVAGALATPFAGASKGAEIVESAQAGAFQPETQAGQKSLQTLGSLIEKGADIVNIPLSGIGGILELVSSQGLDQAVETIKAIQSQGVSKTAGERTFEETGSPLAAAAAETAPAALGIALGPAATARIAKEVAPIAKTAAAATGRVVEPVTTAVKTTAKQVFDFQSPTKQRIAKLIQDRTGDIETAGFKLSDVDKVIKDKVANEAIKQGFDKGVIAAIKPSTQADKVKMLEMVNIMERGKNNARFAATNRPSDVAGKSLMNRFRVIRQANKNAGKQIDKVANSLKGKDIDLTEAVSGFSQTLDDLGVRLIDDGKGGVKPDFEISQLAPGDRGPIKEVIRQMNIQGRGTVDGFSAHRMKRIIDNNVTFGKTKTGLSGDAERALKSFRSGLDEALDNTFPSYDKVNKVYAETIGALDDFQTVAGGKMNLLGDNVDKAVGTLLRRVMSNAQSRINLLDSIDDIERVARKHGAGDRLLIEGKGLGKDDLLNQILFVDELDNVFGPVARTSFQGQIKQGVQDVGGAIAEAKVSPGGAALKLGAQAADKLRRINEPRAFKAIKELLKGGK